MLGTDTDTLRQTHTWTDTDTGIQSQDNIQAGTTLKLHNRQAEEGGRHGERETEESSLSLPLAK